MPKTISRMTPEELKELIRSAVEEAVDKKLTELQRDPDFGLALRKEIKRKLAQQRKAVANGERGRSLPDIIRELSLD